MKKLKYYHLISVVIATRNRSDILQRALQALTCQEAKGNPFEVIVVDDGSNDSTAYTIKNLSFEYPLKYIYQDPRGPAAARNAGMERAEGQIVLFLNDDCLAATDLLACHREFHQKYGECIVLGHIDWAPEIEASTLLKELVNKYYFPYYQIIDQEEVSFAFFITGNLSIPLEKVKETGGFDENFREAAFEDIELGYRLEQRGIPMKYNPHALAYHLHELSFDDLFDRQKKVAYWLNAFLSKHPEAKKYYPGFNNIPEIPVNNQSCLEMILRYASYRGLKEGKADFGF